MAEPDARRFLAALASRGGTEVARQPPADDAYRDRIDAAVAATESFEAAANYLATNDLDDLANAVERADADLSASVADGEAALATMRRLRAAAEGTGQFQSGRGSHLGREDVAATR